MAESISRRDFVRYAWGCAMACSLLDATKAWAAGESLALRPAPYFDLPNDTLVTLSSKALHFGTSIYPFRKDNEIEWLLHEVRALGLTGVRVGFPREHIDHAASRGEFDPSAYNNPYRDITDALRGSNLEVTLTIQGHQGDKQGRPLEWPRNADGSINGRAAAPAFANYTRWLVNHTKDYASIYELWNEAFGHIDDQQFKKSFGPGGSKENADNYSAMMLPAAAEVRKHAPDAAMAIEGNYWNVDRSVGESATMQKLISMADFMVTHPYSYTPAMYDSGSQFARTHDFYRSINPNIQHFFSEYNVGSKQMGFTADGTPERIQAKALLRSTMLHLRHGITRLDMFDLFYPTNPSFSLIDTSHRRKLSFDAFRSLLSALKPGHAASSGHTLTRLSALAPDIRDLAVTNGQGIAYMIWQETLVESFKDDAAAREVSVTLSLASGGVPRVRATLDPMTGREFSARVEDRAGALVVVMPVTDYPRILLLDA